MTSAPRDGGREDLVRPVVILAVVDGDVGTERARERESVVGAGGGDDRPAPSSLSTWMAIVPTPPAAAWIS
jgi:hypothetical protein